MKPTSQQRAFRKFFERLPIEILKSLASLHSVSHDTHDAYGNYYFQLLGGVPNEVFNDCPPEKQHELERSSLSVYEKDYRIQFGQNRIFSAVKGVATDDREFTSLVEELHAFQEPYIKAYYKRKDRTRFPPKLYTLLESCRQKSVDDLRALIRAILAERVKGTLVARGVRKRSTAKRGKGS